MKKQNKTFKANNTTNLTKIRGEDFFFFFSHRCSLLDTWSLWIPLPPEVHTQDLAMPLELPSQEHQLITKVPTRKTSQPRPLHSKDSWNKLFPPKGRTTRVFLGGLAHQEELNRQHKQGSTYHRLLRIIFLSISSGGWKTRTYSDTAGTKHSFTGSWLTMEIC